MGSSKTYRGGPGWTSYSDPPNSTKGHLDKKRTAYSADDGSPKYEGTLMSGEEQQNPRKGLPGSARNKSSKQEKRFKQKTTFGES